MHVCKILVFIFSALIACASGPALSQSSTSDSGQMSAASSAKQRSTSLQPIPAEVDAAIKRMELCHHFAGEIGGDSSDRDKEVGRALRRYRCERVPETIKALKRKYQSNDGVSKVLREAEEANQ